MRSVHPLTAAFLPAVLLFAMPALGAASPRSIAVVTSGVFPGVGASKLNATVLEIERSLGTPAWQFESGAEPSVGDRIEWHFRPNPFAGGAVRSIGPLLPEIDRLFGVHRKISVEAELFHNGQPQARIFDEWTVQGGASDPALRAGVESLTRQLLADAKM
jgi:hypothetical protein